MSRPTLLDSLAVVAPQLPSELTEAGNLNHINTVASMLPPVHYAGFEYHFNKSSKGLDFQQGITLNSQHVGDLAEFAERNDWDTDGSIQRLCRAWRDLDSIVHACLAEVWLEFDTSRASAENQSPSIFITLSDKGKDQGRVLQTVESAHALLVGSPLDSAVAAQISNLVRFAVPYGVVAHVGFFLSRKESPVRLVMPLANKESLLALLSECVHDWDCTHVDTLCAWLFSRFERVRLCLDVDKEGGAEPAFECFFEWLKPDYGGPREILEELVELGLCQAAEAQALLDWPAVLTPVPEWPEDLITRSLTDPEYLFPVLDCRLGHLKFKWGQTVPFSAKAYFGYVERSLQP